MKPDSNRPCPHCCSSEIFRSHRRNAVEKYNSALSTSVRSAALIATPDSMGSGAPTARVAGFQSGLTKAVPWLRVCFPAVKRREKRPRF